MEIFYATIIFDMQELILFLLAFTLGFSVSRLWFVFSYRSNKVKKLDRVGVHKGYHIHHSMYGVTSFMIVPYTLTNHHVLATLVLIGFGLGMIIDHTIEEGFVFITKEDR